MRKSKLSKATFLLPLLLFIVNINGVFASVTDSTRISLAGKWKFALDPTDEGLHKKWFLGNLTDTYLGNILFDVNTLGDRTFIPSLPHDIYLPTTTDIAGFGMPDDNPWIYYLQRKHKYIGPSWFQCVVDIPESWNGYSTALFLERVKWQSRVWVDGKEVRGGSKDGLVTSHQHDLGTLKPGKHLISIRVDNRMIHPIGDKGHNYTELTESIWNGIVGKIELQRKTPVSVQSIAFFPNLKEKSTRIRLLLEGDLNREDPSKLTLHIKDQSGRLVDRIVISPKLQKTDSIQEFVVATPYLKPWDEYEPNLYYVDGDFQIGDQQESIRPFSFGARDIKTNQYKIVVNDVPRYMRGNQEALGYPPTGHPPMDVETWKKIFQIYKDNGLNQVRFHSSCPPDAAFQAADELGIYVMVELVWMTSINAKKDLRPISATMGIPQGLGNNDRTTDDFVFAESKRIMEQYGNHPSFCFFAFGNELDNINKEKIDKWIEILKTDDPRRLYAGTTARAVLPHDDFQDSHIVPGKGPIVNRNDYSNLTNYDNNYQYTTIPVIAHELGQYPVHPKWSDIAKYDNTPFRFINLEKARTLAQKNAVFDQDLAFVQASGEVQQMLYKSEIERQLRSRYGGGFNLLQMNDYTGQGEALVGWLDAFYDSKGITTAEKVRQFTNDVVLLSEFPKYTWQIGETIPLRFLIHTTNPKMKSEGVSWNITNAQGKVIKDGVMKAKPLTIAEPTFIGETKVVLVDNLPIGKYILTAKDLKGKYQNSWIFWIYPKNQPTAASPEIKIANTIQEALTLANDGNSVLFLANNSGSELNKDLAGFVPIFWSTLFFPGRGTKTLGAVIDSGHPIFESFPTDNHYGWQWREVCANARGFVLDGDAVKITPMVQPVDDFHTSRKLATLFELKVGKGKMLVCGYNLTDDLSDKIVSNQLRNSLLNYMTSAKFDPQQELPNAWLINTFATEDLMPAPKKNIPTIDVKSVLPTGASLRMINTNSFEISTRFTTLGIIKLNIHLDGNKAKEVEVFVEHRKIKMMLKPGDNWVTVQYFREDFDDQKLLVGIDAVSQLKEIKIVAIQMLPELE